MAFYTTEVNASPAEGGVVTRLIARLASAMDAQSKQLSRRDQIEALEAKREEARQGGGKARIERQHEKGKLTARERVELLLDDGSYLAFYKTYRRASNMRDISRLERRMTK